MLLESLTQFVHQHLTPAATLTPWPMLLIGGVCLASGLLYAHTRGREFAVCGLASLVYFIPFVR